MSSGIRWNSKLFASYYFDQEDFKKIRDYRAELLGSIIQNTFAATSEGLESIKEVFNHFDRQWRRFSELIDEKIQAKLKELELDWDIYEIRTYDNKQFKKRFDQCSTEEEELLLFQIYSIKREDYENIVKKTDELAYKYWKGEITSREFLTAQHQLAENSN